MRSLLRTAVWCLALGLTAPSVATTAGAASFNGARVDAEFHFASLGSAYSDFGVATIGAGAEYTDAMIVPGFGFDAIDFTDHSVFIDLAAPGIGGFTNYGFNGLFFRDVDNMFGDLTVESIVSTAFAFDPSRIVIGNDGFGLSFRGLRFEPSSTLTITFEPTATVPLPAALPLLLSGLGAFALLRRRRRA